jgi:hypothetical protein
MAGGPEPSNRLPIAISKQVTIICLCSIEVQKGASKASNIQFVWIAFVLIFGFKLKPPKKDK